MIRVRLFLSVVNKLAIVWRCKIFGHLPFEPTNGVEVCELCGSHASYYLDGTQWTDKERLGLIGPIRQWYWGLKRWRMPKIFKRCQQCDHRLVLNRYRSDFCSKKCRDEWIPF